MSQVQCPFCFLVNQVFSGDYAAMCKNCGLSLHRAHAAQHGFKAVDVTALPVGAAQKPASALPAPVAPPPLSADSGTPGVDPVPVASSRHVEVPHQATVIDHGDTVAAPAGVSPALWELVFETGERVVLDADDIVVGRNPQPVGTAKLLKLSDATRTISSTHARLSRHGDTWTIEDLGSANGTALLDATNSTRVITPHQATPIGVADIELGCVRATIKRHEASQLPPRN